MRFPDSPLPDCGGGASRGNCSQDVITSFPSLNREGPLDPETPKGIGIGLLTINTAGLPCPDIIKTRTETCRMMVYSPLHDLPAAAQGHESDLAFLK